MEGGLKIVTPPPPPPLFLSSSISHDQKLSLTCNCILQAFDNRGFPTTIGTDDNCKWKAKFDYLFISIRAEGSDSSDG